MIRQRLDVDLYYIFLVVFHLKLLHLKLLYTNFFNNNIKGMPLINFLNPENNTTQLL